MFRLIRRLYTSTSTNPPKQASLLHSLGKLIPIARPEFKTLGAAILLLSVSSAVSLSVPLSMGTIIDVLVSEKSSSSDSLSDSTKDSPIESPTALDTPIDSEKVGLPRSQEWKDYLRKSVSPSTLALGISGIFLVGGLANAGRVILMRVSAERIIGRLRDQTFTKLIRQDVGFHDANRSAELISRLSTDTAIVGKTLTHNISDGLRSVVLTVAGVGAMCYVNLTLTATIMSIVPPAAFAAVAYGRFVRTLARKTTDATAEITKLAEEKISNIRTVKAFARESSEVKLYHDRVQDVLNLGIKEGYASAALFGAGGVAGNMIMLAILFYGGTLVQAGAISIGDLTTFFLYTAYVGSSLIGLTTWYSELNKGVGASTRIFQLMEGKPTIYSRGKKLESVHGLIKFEDVSFAYPTRTEAKIFDKLSFTVHPGENVAIVGHSGSGKSTVAQLLLRFYDPEGRITLDDTPLKELDTNWLRNSVMGLVSQEPVLFATSILENIRYGFPEATIEQVQRASELANAHQFIISLPKGYDTFVGERGHALSGGQKQRIAIARALLKNPQILILDEATSALDSASEFAVQEAIDRLVEGRTVITIAHRLSTIQKADRILMIGHGAVVETGSYRDLISNPESRFRQLVQAQLS